MNNLILVWETNPLRFLLLSGLLGILFSIVYVYLAEDAAETIIEMRTWTHSGKVRRLEAEDIDFLRTIWPFALVFEVVVFGFIWMIKRIR